MTMTRRAWPGNLGVGYGGLDELLDYRSRLLLGEGQHLDGLGHVATTHQVRHKASLLRSDAREAQYSLAFDYPPPSAGCPSGRQRGHGRCGVGENSPSL